MGAVVAFESILTVLCEDARCVSLTKHRNLRRAPSLRSGLGRQAAVWEHGVAMAKWLRGLQAKWLWPGSGHPRH